MKLAITILIVTLAASAQVAGHTPTAQPATAIVAPSGLPVVRVNGAVLTDRDLVREMLNVFPYAKQHGGKFPKDSEPEIRKAALRKRVGKALADEGRQRPGSAGVRLVHRARLCHQGA